MLLCTLLLSFTALSDTPPNIVVVLVDDLGYGDLGADLPGIGGLADHRTPRITSFAKESLVFTNGYSAGPNCAPSRASLQTGRYTPRHGILTVGNSARGKAKNRALVPIENRTVLADGEITLAEMLAPAGYTSAHIGKWHLGDDARTQGYAVNIAGNKRGHPKSYFSPYKNPSIEDGPEGEYLTTRLTDDAIRLLDELEAPFFLHLAYYTVHTPIRAPKERVDALRAAGVKNPVYTAMVEALDHEFGRLIDALEEKGLAENTLVLFTSDNGGYGPKTNREILRGCKGTLDEGGVRVPWIVRWPGKIAPGVNGSLVHHVDLLPTFASLSGAPVPEGVELDGVNLRTVLLDSVESGRRDLCWHFPCYLQGSSDRFEHFRTEPGGALRSGDLKLIEYFGVDGKGPARVELYDLSEDPLEAHDLAGERVDEATLLQLNLRAWRDSVGAKVPTEAEPRFDAAGS